ncbi:MAG: sigma-70 family RNA polymerase sigma factor [Clostridia bacterium]|nr:sigma-70 family RNA polymerase sigma factor [Clostridia bacterium]
MDDSKIIALFWQRDERALTEFEKNHKRLCLCAANEITGSPADAEECFYDTCLAVWNSIPPEKPESLRAYALRICKNFALNRIKAKSTQKRSAVLIELDECITETLADMEVTEIGALIDTFMETLSKRDAIIFVRRYNCSQPVKDIASAVGMTENQVSKILGKLRKKLQKHLEKEGIRV